MTAHPAWVDTAAVAAGLILAAGCTIALWQVDTTRWMLLAPARAGQWTIAAWQARRARNLAWVDGADLPTSYFRGLVEDMAAARSKPSRARRLDRRWADYRHRCRLQAAGFHGVFPGGPRGALP